MNRFFESVEKINSIINSVVWSPVILALIIFVGIQFSIRLKFFQISHCKLWLKQTFGTILKPKNSKNKKKGITSLQAVSTALASAIGTGNIVGVATAITLGGAGAVFWMWVSAFLGMMTIFAENVLGVKYRKTSKNGENLGGPMYYIEYGLKQKWLAYIFAFACILASFGIGNMTQANSISASLKKSFNFPPAITGIIISTLISFIILGGVNRIAKVSEKIVPFMALFYILGGLIVIFSHINNFPKAMLNILSGAFNLKSAASGVGGFAIANTIKYGISRGIFSNEAGLGSSPIVHAASNETEPVVQGMWGIFQVFVDTILVCSVTAFCILTSGVLPEEKDGALLSIQAFNTTFGNTGEIFVTISITLFAFATIVGWSYYGEKSVEYLYGKQNVLIYKSLCIIFALFGSVMKLDLVWSISDTFNGMMAIPNLIALLFLSNQVVSETKKYLNNKKKV